ncbi:hypothetical protein CCR75_004519 [Bremia lactucae]|uniref:Uncharacterized protein n=1 Tax=Bremia lactucae TaxID=4779 RepID=A0A976FK07_BRELC|nr:hypothetical protein CCR75_004519 [Bremia lactucae]
MYVPMATTPYFRHKSFKRPTCVNSAASEATWSCEDLDADELVRQMVGGINDGGDRTEGGR